MSFNVGENIGPYKITDQLGQYTRPIMLHWIVMWL
jgi:hypothetical protein